MSKLIIQGILSGIRSQSIKLLLALALLLLSSALLAASFSGRQALTVAVDISITSLRLVLLLMALFLIQELLSKDVERKTLYFILAYPITRTQYLLARFISAALLLFFTVAAIGGLIYAIMAFASEHYIQAQPLSLDIRFPLVLFGIWLDLILAMSFITLITTISTTPFLPMLLGLFFTLAARGLGPTFDYLRHNPYADPNQASTILPILDIVQLILPDLSRLDWRAWILYNQPIQYYEMLIAIVMALSYIVITLALAGKIFKQRDLT